MKDINALKDDISDIHIKLSALTNSTSMSNELKQIKASVAKLSIAVESNSNPIYCPPPPNAPECSKLPHNSKPISNVPTINIVAWNCRGVSSGLPYAETLAEHADVLILSEHWLWPFELHKLNDIHPCMEGHAVSDKRLTAECGLSKGCGGIGIIWKKHLHVAPILNVKSDRICAVTIGGCNASILVIGVYLPTTDSPTDMTLRR